MAITLVQRIYDTREQSGSTKDSLTETLVYHVYTDSLSDTASTARTANDGSTHIPQPNSSITISGTSCLVQTVQAERLDDTPYIFIVTVVCGIQPVTGSGAKTEITISVDGAPYTEPIYQDNESNRIGNSANQPFDPPIEQTYYTDEEITVSFKSDTVDVTNISACRGKVNTADVTLNVSALGYSRTFVAKTLKLLKATYTVTITKDNAPLFWQVNYCFGYRPDTWVRKIVDKGLYTLNDDGDLVPIYDREGQPVSSPRYLDGAGQELADGAAVTLLPFDLETYVSFSGLFTGLT